MRMFPSVSGHGSEQSTAHFSSRPIVTQLKGVSDTISNTDHRGHKFSPSLTLLSVQNSNRMASRFTTIASFPSVFLQLLQCSRQHPSFSAHWAALMTKTDLNYPAFSLRFVDFAAQFWFHCKFSFHEKRRSRQVTWFSRTNHNPLLRIATNEIALFCIDHR